VQEVAFMWRPGFATRVSAVVCTGLLGAGLSGLAGTAGAQSEPTVSIGKVKGIGKVLVDANGRPLYSLVNKHKPVPCTGSCLDEFSPLTVAAGSQPTAGKGVKGLGLVAGGTQVTENDYPLFLFPGDAAANEANGQGMKSSGGTWHVVKVTGKSGGGKSGGDGGGNAGTGGVSF
jgi:predicted lipoprotein with Yx(FWY)xxD motif